MLRANLPMCVGDRAGFRRPLGGGAGMPKTLLLADDSVTIQKVVGITFANEDVTLVTVDNGDDALVRARQVKPDCVLADVSMPGLSGYELCAAIRAEPELAHIPVLLLTGTFETYDSQRAGDAGADGYIAKPFEAQALVERVRALLAKPRPAAAPAPQPPAAPPQPPAQPQPAMRPQPVAAAAPPVATPPQRPIAPPPQRPIAPPPPVAQPAVAAPKPISPPTPQKPLAPPPASPAPVAARPMAPPPPPPARALPDPDLDAALDEIPDEQLTVHAPPPELGSADEERAVPTRIFEPGEGDHDFPGEMPTRDPLFGPDPSDSDEPTDPQSVPSGDLFEESSFPDPNALSAATDIDTEPLDPDEGEPEEAEPDTARESSSFRSERAWGAPQAPLQTRESEPEESELPWAEALELDEPESDDSLADVHFAPREPAPELPRLGGAAATKPGLVPPGVAAPAPAAQPAVSAAALPALDARVLREALEKVAWEAFGPLSEQIVRDVVARVEAIAWEVVPQLAERLIREEIAALKRESE
jgi:CheY-like chemotaxis protein